jgi:hypothetical protein
MVLLVMMLSACTHGYYNPYSQKSARDWVPEEGAGINTFAVDEVVNTLSRGESDMLWKILPMWNVVLLPRTQEFIQQNDTVHALYDVFRAFYKLHGYQKAQYQRTRYVVVQNQIRYGIADRPQSAEANYTSLQPIDATDALPVERFFDSRPPHWDSLADFRPPLDISPDSILYMTDRIERAVYEYLGSQYPKAGKKLRRTSPNSMIKYSREQSEFLNPYIPVFSAMWSDYWFIMAFPYVDEIVLGPSLREAYVAFYTRYQGFEMTLNKSNGVWSITNINGTWIE